MKFGLSLGTASLSFPSTLSSLETSEEHIKMAKLAEELEFDSVWCNHHITPPKYLEKVTPRPKFFEPFITLSFIAAATQDIKIGTSIIVLPYKDPINIALQVSSLDVFSKGRLILGVGTGAYKEEFEAFRPGVPISKRSKIMDESLRALKKLLTKKTSFDGEFIKFGEIELTVKPIQKPLPIWMGGNASIVSKRAGLYGEGWFPAVVSRDEIKEGIKGIKTYANKVGRDPSKIEIAPQFLSSIAETRQEALKRYKGSLAYKHIKSLEQSTLKRTSNLMMKGDEALLKRNLIGSPNEIIHQIEEFINAGTTYFASISFVHSGERPESVKNQWKLFARDVLPSFK